MKIKFPGIAFFLLAFLLTAASHSHGRIIVVDNRIEADRAGQYSFLTRRAAGNEKIVFKTIQAAVDFTRQGDTIVIRQGFYPEQVSISKNGITLMSFNNEKVVIDGNNPRLGPLLRIEGSGITIRGLTIMHSSGFGIYAINSDNVLVENCEVAYSEDGGIVFNQSRNIIIDNCRVHHNNYKGLAAAHEGITIRGTRYFEVRNCEVFDNKEEGIDAKYGSSHGRIYNNRVYRNNGPNIYIDKAQNIEVFNNIVHDAVNKAGISVNIESTYHPEGTSWSLHGIKIYNNLVYDNSGGIGFWLEPGRGAEENAHWDSIYIYRNTLVNNSRPGDSRGGGIYVVNGEPHNFGNEIYLTDNIIWERTNRVSRCIRDDAGIISKFNISGNVFPRGEPSDTYGEDPLVIPEIHFADPFNHDYRLKNSSPAAGKGLIPSLSWPLPGRSGIVSETGF
jgi:parallel beta-helix repeat protein